MSGSMGFSSAITQEKEHERLIGNTQPFSREGKSVIKRVLLALAAFLVCLSVLGVTWIKLQFEPSLFRQPFYRLTHDVYSKVDVGESYPSREVAIGFKGDGDNNAEAEALTQAMACVKAFEIRSLQDGQQLTCRVFQNASTFKMYQQGERGCVIATAVQWPYGTAENAEVRMNSTFHCGN
ncbi:hypothetical protein ACFOPQ_05175 [Deinococcus antarcticus]|uniref:Uncharacterized protein n=1 Tax=Deinococcus antarcticus TaxID=1298767 RepID=A0ABV8A7I7_9DEIO